MVQRATNKLHTTEFVEPPSYVLLERQGAAVSGPPCLVIRAILAVQGTQLEHEKSRHDRATQCDG
jgi:hypothetical protein